MVQRGFRNLGIEGLGKANGKWYRLKNGIRAGCFPAFF